MNHTNKNPLHLFEGFGIELEYMIVKSQDLNVAPVADALMYGVTGNYSGDVERPKISWSNELVAHVIELKTSGPAPALKGLDHEFSQEIVDINSRLNKTGHQLLPGAMHPWMDPKTEMHLWSHDNNEVYEAYDRIFSCKGHGWSNLQSMHINLPFANDLEFGRLHAAIRMVLPILPAIAASSPVFEGKFAAHKDARLTCYRKNQAKVPIIAGSIIPEPVFTEAEYRSKIFEKVFEAIRPYDKDNILQNEWLNSRGAIARFDRSAIEIRTIDVQECPAADIAIAALVVSVIRSFVEETGLPLSSQMKWPTAALAAIHDGCIESAELFIISDSSFLRDMGFPGTKTTAKDLWQHLFEAAISRGDATVKAYASYLQTITHGGSLSTRITKSLPPLPQHQDLAAVWRQLGHCLAANSQFGSSSSSSIKESR